jgi:hypothetical protein
MWLPPDLAMWHAYLAGVVVSLGDTRLETVLGWQSEVPWLGILVGRGHPRYLQSSFCSSLLVFLLFGERRKEGEKKGTAFQH